LLSTCGDEKLQDEALAKDWDLQTFMKHATMKQDIKAQTDDMKSEIKAESSDFIRTTYAEKPRGKSSKQKMYSFKNRESSTKEHKIYETTVHRKSTEMSQMWIRRITRHLSSYWQAM
jgi:Skp family chaperone for outer membrane proteins